MTHRATCRLPKKPSELIRVAIADLKKAEKSKDYNIYMGTWHDAATMTKPVIYNPKTCKTKKALPKVDEPCTVCLAGSVMAFSLKAPVSTQLEPADYPASVESALLALDALRTGRLDLGLSRLGVSQRQAEKAFVVLKAVAGDVTITPYDDDNNAFKREMLDMADKLEEIGL